MSDTTQPSNTTPTDQQDPSEDNSNNQTQDNKKKPRTGPKRRKVTHACVYCRRSHMTCDEGRPCQRCIKRSIGHLCHDEVKTPNNSASLQQQQQQQQQQQLNNPRSDIPASLNGNYASLSTMAQANVLGSGSNLGGLPLQFYGQMGAGQLTFASEQMGNEISVISDFLDSLGANGDVQGMYAARNNNNNSNSNNNSNNNTNNNSNNAASNATVNNTERFFLTAADPSDGKLEDRLTEVINAKYEAGFLKPYNYVNGYARLQKYMDNNMSASSRQRILNVMGTFRPAFRSVAQSLTDIDLILVEEAFERLLLDYDRVFSSMGIPACLWRRTGEIYKGNKEFAALVNVPIENLREGRLCIYELMAEESAVNYWEKYGNIAFDPGQKAVLTSCLLKSPDPENTSVISCCFSFTIRRDKYNIPTVIVGNFLPIQLQ
ncbi:hypothetical protein BCV72DRAFT_257809 [Rhizopus microsporus var. microsporus]|uniref:Zn(2)-C6 fungal-type domain-containing protein n=2 Tax=Rhizopus microsporus TaxID=58291 RepID=A0A2G4SSS0_RHIZD|nr:uncharacterized protein RHIMIDRAFT_292672 [Rhizopus microsporus ATCC 52813]ORE03421.1 hypothetical protein BCV72DRAFT_257809 [Rhizopus microsporus var. microsporus]PHZ11801.1 hypothetical protein RHIMIDRAFT_292672 [Rhizopus microsporus ATCC 52813]